MLANALIAQFRRVPESPACCNALYCEATCSKIHIHFIYVLFGQICQVAWLGHQESPLAQHASYILRPGGYTTYPFRKLGTPMCATLRNSIVVKSFRLRYSCPVSVDAEVLSSLDSQTSFSNCKMWCLKSPFFAVFPDTGPVSACFNAKAICSSVLRDFSWLRCLIVRKKEDRTFQFRLELFFRGRSNKTA